MAASQKSANAAGLYIHVPFCRKKCVYCGFYSIADSQNLIDDYLKALFLEMNMYRSCFSRFDTIYIGGGTPSLLSVDQFNAILEHIRKAFTLAKDPEITVEFNPADGDVSYLHSLRETGINRISIGVQSFNDEALTFLGRRHSGMQARNAIADARQAGFKNIGIDLIYGIPGLDTSGWINTLREALSLNVTHLSCYQLTIEENTPLWEMHRAGAFDAPDNERQHELFIITSETAENAGYIHYEVSNFARDESCISKHNSKYWNHTPYLGLGPAAHSFNEGKRWWNKCSVTDYLEDMHAGKPPIASSETLTREQRRLEAMFLGFRTKGGIHLQNFHKRFDYDLLKEKACMIQTLKQTGILYIEDGYLRPTRTGLAVADSLSLI